MASIVLVEDSETDVFLIQDALSAHGLAVDLQVMEDGEQAVVFVDRLDADPSMACPRLFILDVNLPKVSGFEVLARLRRSARCNEIPVLVVTSSDAERDRARIASLGASAYFRKPSGYEAFLKIGEVIRQLLG